MAYTEEDGYVATGFEDKAVKAALKMIENNSVIHNKHEGIWRAIQELFESAFVISNPTGTKKISSKLILQILWKVVNKMKPLDFKIHKSGPFEIKGKNEMEQEAKARDLVEQAVTVGVATVMKEGRFAQCLRDKGGAFYKSAMFGDSHIQVGYDGDGSSYPISFKVGSLSDIYMNSQATDVRDPVGGLSCDEMVLIFRYTGSQFDSNFPEMAGKVAKGEIPRSYRYRKQLEKTWLQTTYDEDDMIEVAFYYSVGKCQAIFAGAGCTLIEKLEGDKDENAYPYIMDGKPYIPILHFKFFPSSEGYYNYGIGHMIFDLAVVTAQMDNMAYSHAGDNIYPITFVNTANKNASKLFNEILKAHEMRAANGKGYVISENQLGQGSGVTLEQFQTSPITQEWERAFMRLEQQITRMGFRLDAPDLGSSPNEMSIMAEQESTDAPIKQIMEFNASEFEMAVNITMDFIRKFIDDDDQTPINSTVDIESGDATLPIRGIPLGWIAQELRANKYFVEINSRSGTIPSNVMQQAQIGKAMSTLQPMSPAWLKMSAKMAKLLGQNIAIEDMTAQPQGAPQGVAPGMEGAVPAPTETTELNAAQLKYAR